MDARREIPVAAPQPGPSATEVARLEALRRLAMGAAHAMNNAFTAVMGEAQFLYEDRKDDPTVAEACEAILEQIERCGRITRALLARRHPSQAGGSEVDLARLVRELGNLLHETLGRSSRLEVVFPDDLLLVRGDAEALELAVLTLVHHAVDQAGAPVAIRLAAEAGPTTAGILVELEGDARATSRADDLRHPERLQEAVARSQLQAVHDVCAAQGGRLHVGCRGPEGLVVRLEFPRID
jgi:signal transduction histidine kinase